MQRMQRGLAFVAALMIAWRLHDTIPFLKPETAEKELPTCCHGE
jgi:hypothetical protein